MTMIKKLFLLLFAMLLTMQVSAQFGGYDPVSMEEFFTVNGEEGSIRFEATIEEGYHLYSTDIPKGGPTPVSIKFHVMEGTEVVGPLVAGEGAKQEYDDLFDMNVSYFENEAVLIQQVKLLGGAYRIEGTVSYQSCGNGSCYMGRYDFELTGTADVQAKAEQPKAEQPKVIEKKEEPKPEVKAAEKTETKTSPVVAPAVKEKEAEKTSMADGAGADAGEKSVEPTEKEAADTIAADKPLDKSSKEYHWRNVEEELKGFNEEESSSLWMLFVLGFGGGLIALLTPCVWPIIPMTVSFFLKRSKERSKAIREAMIYGVSIVVIYLVLGIVVTLIFGAGALNALATNAVFNIFFFLMLVLFGASFLGGFELTLPSSWTNKVDEKAGSTTGVLSIFLMAFTLVLVSFSCTGPIIGFLLVSVSDSGEILAPAVGMFGFALALALPFTLFAIFPSLIKQAPRSGGWMNTIKVVLGFVELAFALKFLSVADLAYGWGILDRETFLALWIVLFALLGLYLLKIIRFPHDDPEDKTTSVPGFFMGLVSLAFAVYMIPGLWGAPCKAISAFAPPLKTQDFNLYVNDFKPHVDDFDKALEMSREQKKPVLLDFTGHGCVNCREMELKVWSDDRVIDIMRDKYIVASLYVDDKTELETPFRVEVEDENGNRKAIWITTVGEKWTYLQNSKFGASAQPFYVLVDGYGDPLSASYSYDTDIDNFIEFLEGGLENYGEQDSSEE
jgi:thiol:disulfide interchange protein DsbD